MDRLGHPHSGIATVTVMLEGAVRAADTTGTDLVPKGASSECVRGTACGTRAKRSLDT